MAKTKVLIETERLTLRELYGSDWLAVHEYAQNADILIYEAWGPNSEADTKQFIKTAVEDQIVQSRTSFDLAIILKKEQKLIGGCRFWFSNVKRDEVYIGYIINPLYWKNGYATEAAQALIDYTTVSSKIKSVNATCDVLNIASQKVLGKCGFKLISTIEKDFKMKGRYRDTYVYEKLI
jgi:ribosomal-protein-alanine N-acetyltransferase